MGISERSLQLVFRETLGMAPKAWFRLLALERVRRSLIRRESKPGIVAEQALRYSFDHLGRFSQDYRKLFGESPSQTVLRSGF